MRVKIIGSAAGGGFPQWNCNYRLSRAARTCMPGVQSRTQSSVAASADGTGWVLFNASPDIRQQIAQTPELQPAADAPLRSTPIRAVVLTNADVDHVAGLLSLRERQPFAIYATAQVLATLKANSIFNVLDPAIVPRRLLAPTQEMAICGADGHATGVVVSSFPVPGKVALYLEQRGDPDADFSSGTGDTIGVRISGADGRGAVFYVPGCARIDAALRERLAGAACLLFDGTVYTDDEMITAGVGQKTGARMGHIAMSGEAGSIAGLADVKIGRRIFIHVNNTNPVLDESSAAHAAVKAADWEVAADGMEMEF
ncbi:pyrroloquinoline quinone biosynthesis protein PqqB [Mesorhizobium sp. M2D.F.Ca.ET.185.01.1.1]|uniref:pyrroloquinoline quinone biosynthesis protein PqqB n=1 Tax=unclassified Mesorhizobium TaxID=325217 RepID=UPI000FCB98FD|nr:MULTISPECIES: pyrroloquinoline quinone biosynthesis protein PqqB [unclassified Mesorhizobium]TGP82799.1 pyrroloquinoline quinone biosynthesis protein PqqB [bacterium M00.F.Ca.ET.227.01.1.1]TGP94650.1 pyrroloquinoline quinone biosynthesis protein PqqB [bacterium M00.F.Ca.ET.221.01.1.1]TGP97995.1 pyrroloquinoline quinone biosynthesis protein PqqB [bacterium M00.F.Ca.ET.222.01.1.1]TGU02181.1 pyrroloquinoline quinone biosynthesis protein PqqB [bacterium M00.F.Ca.ET.163.01.1.1]TGU19529.1 pyrrolo